MNEPLLSGSYLQVGQLYDYQPGINAITETWIGETSAMLCCATKYRAGETYSDGTVTASKVTTIQTGKSRWDVSYGKKSNDSGGSSGEGKEIDHEWSLTQTQTTRPTTDFLNLSSGNEFDTPSAYYAWDKQVNVFRRNNYEYEPNYNSEGVEEDYWKKLEGRALDVAKMKLEKGIDTYVRHYPQATCVTTFNGELSNVNGLDNHLDEIGDPSENGWQKDAPICRNWECDWLKVSYNWNTHSNGTYTLTESWLGIKKDSLPVELYKNWENQQNS